jgi:hypothetical protein
MHNAIKNRIYRLFTGKSIFHEPNVPIRGEVENWFRSIVSEPPSTGNGI